MKMDGYDVEHIRTAFSVVHKPMYNIVYKVYTLDGGKHYRNGYSSYKLMIAAHPELKR